MLRDRTTGNYSLAYMLILQLEIDCHRTLPAKDVPKGGADGAHVPPLALVDPQPPTGQLAEDVGPVRGRQSTSNT